MERRERLARMLCKRFDIDPDRETVGITDRMGKGRNYKLWEYQAEQYVDPILEELEKE